MRESRAWRAAGKMPKGKEKTAAYRELEKRFSFREYDLYSFIQEQRRSWIGEHIDARTAMDLAARAFAAVEQAIFNCGRVRFRRFGELRSVGGKCAESALRWDGSHVVWSGLKLPASIDKADPVVAHGLAAPFTICRIVRMRIRGTDRYYAQIVCEGEAYKKPEHTTLAGVVGLDIGPSTIAVVAEKSAKLLTFCNEMEDRREAIGDIQRQEQRKRVANNPGNYEANGQFKPRSQRKPWKISRRHRRLADQRVELQRCEREHRKNLHGRLAHEVLAAGDDIRTEKLSYRAFARRYGKSVGLRAPGTFIATLKRSAEKVGAKVTEFSTRRTCLSQTCPKCGTMRKKSLSEREHVCACGARVPRDISAAHLARFVIGDKLDMAAARKAWRGACNLLRSISSSNNSAMTAAPAVGQRKADSGRVLSNVNARRNPISAADAVAGRKVQARAAERSGRDGRTIIGSQLVFFEDGS